MSSPIYAHAADMWAAMRAEFELVLEAAIVEAEVATNGNLINALGRDRGVAPTSLFTGPAARAYRYASEELRDHWQAHGRPSLATFEAEWLDAQLGR